MRNSLRGRFSIELPDGTEVDTLVNLYTVHVWCEATGSTLDDLDAQMTSNPLAVLPSLLWEGVKAHHALERTEPGIEEQRFKILFGSADWAAAADSVGKALNLDPQPGPGKKKPARR